MTFPFLNLNSNEKGQKGRKYMKQNKNMIFFLSQMFVSLRRDFILYVFKVRWECPGVRQWFWTSCRHRHRRQQIRHQVQQKIYL